MSKLRTLKELHPIFFILLEEISEKEVNIDNSKISRIITNLPDEEIEMIYSFIICYSKYKNPNIGNHIIPYRGAPLKSLRGIKFYISDLPNELLKIIFLYLEKISM